MNAASHTKPDRPCPHCGTWQTTGDDRQATCHFCHGRLTRERRSELSGKIRKGLTWLARGYRQWSLAIFAGAIVELLWLWNAKSFLFGFVVLFPFTVALALAHWTRKRNATSRWIIAFLVLVDLGVVIAPTHQILPWLNMFPEIPLTQNRIISWYVLVYFTLQFGVVPPVALGRCLRTAWRGEVPALSTWICLFGFAVWGLLMSVVAMVVVTTLT
jgi:hypothetical protein